MATKRAAGLALAAFGLAACGGGGSGAPPTPSPTATPPLSVVASQRVSSDPFSTASTQHATEVESYAAVNGTTIVSVFQVARAITYGSADTGFATSTNGGGSDPYGVAESGGIGSAPERAGELVELTGIEPVTSRVRF